ncbi:MAG TPA: DedA family protein [Hyphomicrobiales bacterium]|nr:DedA family protein [Hyphomicrobiales bacterium]
MDVVADIQHFLLAHKDMAGPILGVIAFGESLILIGLFFPATAIMLFTGGLLQKGVLDPATVILWSIAGAVLGDIVTYWLGRWIGPSVVHHWPVNRIDKTNIARARLFFRKYGFLSIFIGRFLGPVRSTIPLVAGIMRMRHLTFQIANVTSAIAWVPIMLSPGYFFARTIGDFGDLTTLEWAAIIVSILVLTAAFTIIAARMAPRGTKERRQGRQRREPAAAE